jgi:hypothetical protein
MAHWGLGALEWAPVTCARRLAHPKQPARLSQPQTLPPLCIPSLPACLPPSRSSRALLWLFSYSFFVNMMASGLVASSASSLERRYGFSKTRLGVLLSTSDIIACE